MSVWRTLHADGRREFLGMAEAGQLHIVSDGDQPESQVSIDMMCGDEQVFFAACARRDVKLSSWANMLRLTIGSCLIGLSDATTRGACTFLGIAMPPGDPQSPSEPGADCAALPFGPDGNLGASPTPAVPPAGGSDPSLDAEHAGMSEMQVADHPVLRACAHGHTPHMYEAKGNLRIAYYVECSPCRIRTTKVSNPSRAATEWNTRATMPIQFTAAA